MRSTLRFVFATAVLLAASFGSSFAQGKYTLQLNLTKGNKYAISTTLNQKITGNMQGQSMAIDQRMNFDFLMRVGTVRANGNAVVTTSYDRLAMVQSINAGGESMETVIDTKDSSKNKGMMADMMKDKLQRLIGLAYDMEFAKDGSVVHSNLDSVLSANEATEFGGSSENNQFAVAFPNHPVAIGDSWHVHNVRHQGDQDIVSELDYTLRSVKENVAEIGVVSTMSGDMSNGKLTGKIDGAYTLDLASGWTKDAKMNMDMTLEVKNEEDGTTSPMKITSEITITSRKQ